ncbi:MAG: YgjV family protein [Eubacterium sp.]|nr:YgjV family protein [Eubacterium sp.]
MLIELIGYLGSVLVVVSMLMSSVVKLRVINTAGSCISATYALIIHSYPLALMNICLIVINLYNLAKLSKNGQHYNLVGGKTDDPLLAYFLSYFQQDIQNFFPETANELSAIIAAAASSAPDSLQTVPDLPHVAPDDLQTARDLCTVDTAYIVCCDAIPAGVLLGKLDKNGTLAITVDYTTPFYRDCSVGGFLYSKLPERGILRLTYSGNSQKHESYLLKMGFQKENGIYVKQLK